MSWPPDSTGRAHVLLVSFQVSELGAVGFPRFVRMEAFLCHSHAEERSLTAEPGLGWDPERGLLSSGTHLIAFRGADASMWHQIGLPGKHWQQGGTHFSCYRPSDHGAGRPLFLGKSVYSTLGTLFLLNQQRVSGPLFLVSLCPCAQD